MNLTSQQNPILSEGGFLKGRRHRIHTPGKRESLTFFGCLNLKTQKFYWKKSQKGNSDQFIYFLAQLKQNNPGKTIIIILDNASIHRSKKVRRYIEKHTEIKLLHLPTYSPEYNPVEIFWKWIKSKIYGFKAIGGIQEVIKRFRKFVWHYNHDRLVKPIQFQLDMYQEIL